MKLDQTVECVGLDQAYLLGISLFVIGSYPTHLTPAFSQDAQLGSFWSHLFFLNLQRLHALTFLKLELWPAFPPAPPSRIGSRGGERPVADKGSWPNCDTGDFPSGGDCRARFEGYPPVDEAGDRGFMARYGCVFLSRARFRPWYGYRMTLGQRMHDFAGEKEEMGADTQAPVFCKKQKVEGFREARRCPTIR